MLKFWARMPFFFILVAATALAAPGKRETGPAPAAARRAPPQPAVYLAKDLSPENLVVLSSALGARDPAAVLLLDTRGAAGPNRAFLDEFRPSRVVPIGDFSEEADELAVRLGRQIEPPLRWTRRAPLAIWRELYPRAHTVVVCPPSPPGLLLQAGCLAGLLDAPLYIQNGHSSEAAELRHLLANWDTRHVFTLGEARLPIRPSGFDVTHLEGERETATLHRRLLSLETQVRNLVVANPADRKPDKPGMSALAPWIALQRRAALVLTGPAGSDADEQVRSAIARPGLEKADTLILVADLDAVPVHKRPNPIAGGKDPEIFMEPLTPAGTAPFSFATGRLFHPDPGIVPLMMARPRLMAKRAGSRKALLVSNTGGALPLLEAISRQTARELSNAGFKTTALYGKEITRDQIRSQLPLHDVFVWEGHHNQLINDWEFPSWTEPLPSSLIFLQSCLALKEWKIESLFRRGAVGVIGSSTRTYSASGGATSLAFFDAMIHDDLPLGEALRQSKNFMMAYVLLKQKRLGGDAKKSGANLRAAWSFTLWGDPTIRLPRERTEQAPAAVKHAVRGNTITFVLPPEKLEVVQSGKYHAEVFSNSRLAGLLGDKGDDGKGLQQLVFAEVHLPRAPDGKVPRLSTKLPTRNWAFNWDARLQRGYLLAVPRAKDVEELKFVVHWMHDGAMSYADE